MGKKLVGFVRRHGDKIIVTMAKSELEKIKTIQLGNDHCVQVEIDITRLAMVIDGEREVTNVREAGP